MLRTCRFETENPAAPETIRLQIETPCYQRNVEETKLATISEQMRLLYVAMTRAELKLYLVEKGRGTNCVILIGD